MTKHAYTEDALVERATVEVLASLKWSTVSAVDEIFGPDGTIGRQHEREVVLVPRLRAALATLNPEAPAGALDLAIDELLLDRVAMGPAAANREVHRLLTEGVTVTLKDERTGKDEPRTLRVVDWDLPGENDFLAVEQLSVRGPLYTCIPDEVLFVNGLPWVVIELKRPGVPARQAFDENLTSYKHAQNPSTRAFPVPIPPTCSRRRPASSSSMSTSGMGGQREHSALSPKDADASFSVRDHGWRVVGRKGDCNEAFRKAG